MMNIRFYFCVHLLGPVFVSQNGTKSGYMHRCLAVLIMRGIYPPVIKPLHLLSGSQFLLFKEPELEILYKLKELVCTMMDLTQRGLIIITSQNLSLEKF
jgi:hypothetical protein